MSHINHESANNIVKALQGYGVLVIMGENVQFTKKFAESLEYFIFQQLDLDKGIFMALIKHVELIDIEKQKEFCITVRRAMEMQDPGFESLRREKVNVD